MQFKVGDRVAVYNSENRYTGTVTKISSEFFTDCIFVAREKSEYVYHKKQCRKLVKKERRRVWVRFEDPAGSTHSFNPACAIAPDWAEFVEVRQKK